MKLPFTSDPGNRAVQSQKAALRHTLGQRRRTISADLQDTSRWKITNYLRTLTAGAQTVGLYYPQGKEVDLRPYAQELWEAGVTVALPRVAYRSHPLTYNIWPPHGPLEPDALGIPSAMGEEIWPTLLIIPMLGYNRQGYRLGGGGGYYDRTLKNTRLPTITVGVCQTELEIPEFPKEYSDIRLDYIVTGKEVILCQ